jgi:hypothetical protein
VYELMCDKRSSYNPLTVPAKGLGSFHTVGREMESDLIQFRLLSDSV